MSALHRIKSAFLAALCAILLVAQPAAAQVDPTARGMAIIKSAKAGRDADVLSRLRRNIARGGVPVAMASPPTITVGTTATLSRQYERTSGAITFLSATWVDDTPNSRISPITADTGGTGVAYVSGGAVATRVGNGGSAYMWTDGPDLELEAYWGSNKIRIYVRNEFTQKWEIAGDATSTNSTTRHFVKLAFGSALPTGRLVRIDGDLSLKFVRARVAPTYTVWGYKQDAPIKAIFFGDSYFGGGITDIFSGQYHQVCFALGLDDCRRSSLGGTGFSKPNVSTPAVNFYDRYVSDIINQGPFDVVVIGGSGNDYDQTLSTVTSNAGAMFDAIHSAFPDAIIISSNSWGVGTSNSGSPQPSRADVSTAIEAAWAGRPWLRTINVRDWINGTGKAGATTGDGNADRYIDPDYIHHVQVGHEYWARRFTDEVREATRLPTN